MDIAPLATAVDRARAFAASLPAGAVIDEATGFTAGEVYRAAFRSSDGRVLPAGEFLGTGESSLRCNLQAALLRQDTDGFLVLDADGWTVLSAELQER